jgi:hypothetical protein
MLYLLWHKWDVEVLEQQTPLSSGSDVSSSPCLSFLKVLNRASQYQDEKDLKLELGGAVRFNVAIQQAEGVKVECPSNLVVHPTSVADSAISTVKACDDSQPKFQDVLTELHESYSAMLARPDNLAHSLEDLVLSQDMLLLMGYPLAAEQEAGGFVATDSWQWSNSIGAVQKSVSCGSLMTSSTSNGSSGDDGGSSVLEDGEEREDGEEEEEDETVGSGGSEEGEVSSSDSKKHIFFDGDGAPGNVATTSFLSVVAIDCEMCSTEAGLEVTRVTLVCPLKGVVYDELVSYCCQSWNNSSLCVCLHHRSSRPAQS